MNFKINLSKYKYEIIVVCLILFLFGLYVHTFQTIQFKNVKIEPLQNRTKQTARCPNVLIRRGNHIYMYNSTDRDYSSPVHFNNLDEYIDYVEQQRQQGNVCPVLFLQEENDAQGNDVYRVRPSPFDLQPGMGPLDVQKIVDSSRNKDYNIGTNGFDPYGQDVGIYNELDKIHDSTATNSLSDNAMDTNWGGVEHTQEAVESGKYEKRQVTKPTYFTPSSQFNPGLGGRIPPHSFISSAGTDFSNHEI